MLENIIMFLFFALSLGYFIYKIIPRNGGCGCGDCKCKNKDNH